MRTVKYFPPRYQAIQHKCATPDGVVKLMDFGIAKVYGQTKILDEQDCGYSRVHGAGADPGRDASTRRISMPPGHHVRMLSGKLPFESDTDFNLMQAILKERVKSPEKLNTSIPKALGDIIMKALEKNPASRYEDARAFQRALMNAFPQYRDVNLEILNKPAAMYARGGRSYPAVKAMICLPPKRAYSKRGYEQCCRHAGSG